MSVFEEKQPHLLITLAILVILFIFSFPIWFIGAEQITSHEGIFATAALELTHPHPFVTLHGVPVRTVYPLYPILVRAFHSISGCSLEFSLRIIPLFALVLIICHHIVICNTLFGKQAAIAVTVITLTTYLVAFHTVDGYPYLVTTLFLELAWSAWFYLGYMQARWNWGLISVACFSMLAFYSGGVLAFLCAIFPIIVQQRPLYIVPHLRSWGMIVAVLVIFCSFLSRFVAWQNYSSLYPIHSQTIEEESVFLNFFLHLLFFPIHSFLQFLPWSLLIWLPFCPVFFRIEKSPMVMKYFRVLAVALFVLLWIYPSAKTRELFYLFPPIAILLAADYWLMIRRYSTQIFFITRCAAFAVMTGSLLLLVYVCFQQYYTIPFLRNVIRSVFHIVREPVYSSTSSFSWIVPAFSCFFSLLLAVISLFLNRKKNPPWMIFSFVFLAFLVAYWGMLVPVKSLDRSKISLAKDISDAIAEQKIDKGKVRLFKDMEIRGLYDVCTYIGYPVMTIDYARTLPELDPEYPCFVMTATVPHASVSQRNLSLLLQKEYRGNNFYLYLVYPYQKE